MLDYDDIIIRRETEMTARATDQPASRELFYPASLSFHTLLVDTTTSTNRIEFNRSKEDAISSSLYLNPNNPNRQRRQLLSTRKEPYHTPTTSTEDDQDILQANFGSFKKHHQSPRQRVMLVSSASSPQNTLNKKNTNARAE